MRFDPLARAVVRPSACKAATIGIVESVLKVLRKTKMNFCWKTDLKPRKLKLPGISTV
jgi:hypothetical protein